MTNKTNNNADPLWLRVAVELKKTANASTSVHMKTAPAGQFVLTTEKAIIRMVKSDSSLKIRSADFQNGDFWQVADNENALILGELSDGEKIEFKKNFGITI